MNRNLISPARLAGALAMVLALVLPAASHAQTGDESGIQLDLDLEELLREEEGTGEGTTPAPELFEPIESITGGASDRHVVSATGAELRGLDKVAGEARDITIAVGETAQFGRLSITLDDCRYPEGEAAAEAYAHLQIADPHLDEPAFRGWMIASSPALSALDHARFDVWLLRCNNS